MEIRRLQTIATVLWASGIFFAHLCGPAQGKAWRTRHRRTKVEHRQMISLQTSDTTILYCVPDQGAIFRTFHLFPAIFHWFNMFPHCFPRMTLDIHIFTAHIVLVALKSPELKNRMKESALAKSNAPNPFFKAHVIIFELILLTCLVIEGLKFIRFLLAH